ncbi:hypothetical protein AB0J55_19220 [Amycolatopsis sp. NPDC049688]|uniref:hypothetical protein n=1 Tax=Amycolatopsis sp. NPDC049688 TaxID=3154733 RepID=UPI003418A23A
MAPPVKSGHFYLCPFGSNGFTSQTGKEVVLVLAAKFGKADKECLVARAQEVNSEWKVDLDHVYTVVSGTLEEYPSPLDDRKLREIRKALSRQIESAK